MASHCHEMIVMMFAVFVTNPGSSSGNPNVTMRTMLPGIWSPNENPTLILSTTENRNRHLQSMGSSPDIINLGLLNTMILFHLGIGTSNTSPELRDTFIFYLTNDYSVSPSQRVWYFGFSRLRRLGNWDLDLSLTFLPCDT